MTCPETGLRVASHSHWGCPLRQSKARPHLEWFCPFATSDGSSFLEEACLPPAAARAASLPVLLLSWSLPYTVPHLLLRGGPFADVVVPVVLVWFLWLPATLLLRKATSGRSFPQPTSDTQKAPREICLVDRTRTPIRARIECLLHAAIGEPLWGRGVPV